MSDYQFPQSISGNIGVTNFPATQAVSGTVAVSNFATPIGGQANAWNNVAVVSGTTSASIDCQYVATISIFGTVNANLNPLRIQASQDNVNFYTLTTLSLATGNWGTTLSFGARYMRLQAGQSATITATIAGK